MDQVLRLFGDLLKERLDQGKFMTEDTVRYTFFHALLSRSFCSHVDVVMELPHPAINSKEMDTVIHLGEGHLSAAFEFKYHRRNPGGTSGNVTQRAGAIFDDVFRLAHVPRQTAFRGYLVYLTDSEMARYLSNSKNGLTEWFRLSVGESLSVGAEFVTRRSKTFQNRIEIQHRACEAVCVVNQELPDSHSLRVYRIEA